MPGFSPTSVTLTHHTEGPVAAVRSIKTDINTTSDGDLHLHYMLEGELDQLAIPARTHSAHADNLWRHTCFEAFITGNISPVYFEFNFSPSTQWAAYGFTRYRKGMAPLRYGASTLIEMRYSNDRLELDARIPHMVLKTLPGSGGLRLALAAVIEEKSGLLSYWALTHPPGSPDFHHSDSFALHLQRPVPRAPHAEAEFPP